MIKVAKFIVFDYETTSTNNDRSTIGAVELGYRFLDENREEVYSNTVTMNAFYHNTAYTPKALEVNGRSVKEIQTFMHPKEAYSIFLADVAKYVAGRATLIGFNSASFDIPILKAQLAKWSPSTNWYNWFEYKDLDMFQAVLFLQDKGVINVGKSQSLENVCKFYKIEHKPHNCASDVDATHKLYLLLRGL